MRIMGKLFPRAVLISMVLIAKMWEFYSVIKVSFLIFSSLRATSCSKRSPFSIYPLVTPSLILLILPDLRMQNEEANYPSLHILVYFQQYWLMAMSARACRYPLDSSLRQADLSMKILFSLQVEEMISQTAVLKVLRSIYHKKQTVQALIEADLGALNRRASYPNPPSAGHNLFLISPSISTFILPSCSIKKQLALSPCFMRQSPSQTLQKLNFSSKISLMLGSRQEKVKCEMSESEMIFLSCGFFFLKMLIKCSQIISSPSSLSAQSFLMFLRSSQSPSLV